MLIVAICDGVKHSKTTQICTRLEAKSRSRSMVCYPKFKSARPIIRISAPAIRSGLEVSYPHHYHNVIKSMSLRSPSNYHYLIIIFIIASSPIIVFPVSLLILPQISPNHCICRSSVCSATEETQSERSTESPIWTFRCCDAPLSGPSDCEIPAKCIECCLPINIFGIRRFSAWSAAL